VILVKLVIMTFQNVRALQTDMDDLYKRVNMGVAGGWITIGEARKVVGLDADDKS
jgi:hypothetical protein